MYSFISGINAHNAMKRIRAGKTAKLSIAQITNLIINLPDAQKNLNKEEFRNVYSIYLGLCKVKQKIKMNCDKYLDTAIWIIKKFDAYAPYEKYSGGNEVEFAGLMDEIRND